MRHVSNRPHILPSRRAPRTHIGPGPVGALARLRNGDRAQGQRPKRDSRTEQHRLGGTGCGCGIQ